MIPNQVEPYGCLKSDHNYPSLAAPRLGYPDFRDASCSGAKTNHMTTTQNVDPGPNPPQFDRLAADTRSSRWGSAGTTSASRASPRTASASRPRDHPPRRADRRARTSTRPAADEVSRRIAETAPRWHRDTGHPLALSVRAGAGGELLGDPAPHRRRLLAAAAAGGGRRAVAAREAGGAEPDAGGPDRRQRRHAGGLVRRQRGHDACKLPTIRWVEPATPASPAAPVHPNLWGMQAAAQLVVTARGLGTSSSTHVSASSGVVPFALAQR